MNKKGVPEGVGSGIMLIGIGLIFLLRIGFWPWILVAVAAAGLPVALSGHHGWKAWEGFFWLAGIALLFATGLFWPGILVLVGLRALLRAVWDPTEEEAPFGVDEDDQDGVISAPLVSEVKTAPTGDTAPLDEDTLAEIEALAEDDLDAELEESVEQELEGESA